MMKKLDIYVTSFGSLIELLLRRSVYLPVQCSTIASQFTQSEAKGRTLVYPVHYSPFTIYHPIAIGSPLTIDDSRSTTHHSRLTTHRP